MTGARLTVERVRVGTPIGKERIADKAIGAKAIGDRANKVIVRQLHSPERPKRVDVSIEAVLTTADRHSFTVMVRDLSANGFRLELDEEVLVGEHVLLQVGSREPLGAEIKWALGREAGGHFLDSDGNR